MFTHESATQLAYQIEHDWNTTDLNDFLDYFTEDIEIISTNIQRFISESGGKLNGKASLKAYWEYAREKFPYFKYKLAEVNFQDNKLILKFINDIDQTYSLGMLFFNDQMKIYKMQISYV